MSVMTLQMSAPAPALSAVTSGAGPVLELVLSGDLDMQCAEELERYLTGAIERGCDVVVDLTDVRLLDCMCLNILVRAARAAEALHRVFRLVAPSALVRMTMRCTGTDIFFVICDDRATALRACGALGAMKVESPA